VFGQNAEFVFYVSEELRRDVREFVRSEDFGHRLALVYLDDCVVNASPLGKHDDVAQQGGNAGFYSYLA